MTHLMGRSGPPGRSVARRDAPASGKHRDALRRAATPHRRPQFWARSTRREALVVGGTTAPSAPNERAQNCGEMSHYHRDLVLTHIRRAVDVEGGAGQVARLVRAEEGGERADLLGRRHLAERDGAHHPVDRRLV